MKLSAIWRPEAIHRGRDPNVGANMLQLTNAALVSHNIYCETRYTSADGTRVAFLRSALGYSPAELWVCDLQQATVAPICDGVCGHPATIHYGNALFFIREKQGGARILMRVDLTSLVLDEILDLAGYPVWRHPAGSVSPDGRYYVSNMRVRDEIYALYRIDLASGKWEVFHEHAEICNPHHQYEPGAGKDILVQLNRGCKMDADANIVRLVGQEGATLYLIDSEGGNVRPLPVGKPHTGPVTGHECWIGRTGRILLTLSSGPARQELHVVTPGQARSTCLAKGLPLMHVAASDDGRFFITDDISNGRIYIGDVRSGYILPLCESGTSTGGSQATHTHPYMTPDNRYVIFNSDRTGLPQLWAAEIPDGFLEAVSKSES